jgi:hypothetical protein
MGEWRQYVGGCDEDKADVQGFKPSRASFPITSYKEKQQRIYCLILSQCLQGDTHSIF